MFIGLFARGLRTGHAVGVLSAVVLALCILAHIVPALFALGGGRGPHGLRAAAGAPSSSSTTRRRLRSRPTRRASRPHPLRWGVLDGRPSGSLLSGWWLVPFGAPPPLLDPDGLPERHHRAGASSPRADLWVLVLAAVAVAGGHRHRAAASASSSRSWAAARRWPCRSTPGQPLQRPAAPAVVHLRLPLAGWLFGTAAGGSPGPGGPAGTFRAAARVGDGRGRRTRLPGEPGDRRSRRRPTGFGPGGGRRARCVALLAACLGGGAAVRPAGAPSSPVSRPAPTRSRTGRRGTTPATRASRPTPSTRPARRPWSSVGAAATAAVGPCGSTTPTRTASAPPRPSCSCRTGPTAASTRWRASSSSPRPPRPYHFLNQAELSVGPVRPDGRPALRPASTSRSASSTSSCSASGTSWRSARPSSNAAQRRPLAQAGGHDRPVALASTAPRLVTTTWDIFEVRSRRPRWRRSPTSPPCCTGVKPGQSSWLPGVHRLVRRPQAWRVELAAGGPAAWPRVTAAQAEAPAGAPVPTTKVTDISPGQRHDQLPGGPHWAPRSSSRPPTSRTGRRAGRGAPGGSRPTRWWWCRRPTPSRSPTARRRSQGSASW